MIAPSRFGESLTLTVLRTLRTTMTRTLFVVGLCSFGDYSSACVRADETFGQPCETSNDCPEAYECRAVGLCWPLSVIVDDSCDAAFDGECDDPGICSVGTDATDCGQTPTDLTDDGPDSCPYALDDVCDEPNLCAAGTDSTDCDSGGTGGGGTAGGGNGEAGASCSSTVRCADGLGCFTFADDMVETSHDDTIVGFCSVECSADSGCGAGLTCSADFGGRCLPGVPSGASCGVLDGGGAVGCTPGKSCFFSAGLTGTCADSIDGWLCSVSYHAASDGCDCGCGIDDPDCNGAGSSTPGLGSTSAGCDYCHVGLGGDVDCQ
jgi:hypothetical protein